MPNEAMMQQVSEAMQTVRTSVGDAKTLLADLKALMAGTRTVVVSGLPAVTLNGTPTVALSGTPSVAVQGTVPISYTSAYPTLTVQRTTVTLTSAGNLVAAQTGQAIRVLSLALWATVAIGVTLQSNTTAISPSLPVQTTAPIIFPFDPHGWFETVAGDPLRASFTGVSTLSALVRWVAV